MSVTNSYINHSDKVLNTGIMHLLIQIHLIMKQSKGFKSEDQKGNDTTQTTSLEQVQRRSLDTTAAALQSVIEQQKISEQNISPNGGNILIAKQDLVDAMVNLAIASSHGSYAKTRNILSEYGLEDMI